MVLPMMGAVLTAATAPPTLPAPDGRYSVGIRQIEFTTPTGRVLPAVVWYPARSKSGATRPYLTAVEARVQIPALSRNLSYEPSSIAAMATALAHSTIDAPPLRVRGTKFPIVIFSHGLFCYPKQNTALLERLASHGYIVVTVAHPGDAVDIQLADGAIVPTSNETDPDQRLLAAFYAVTAAKTFEDRTAGFKGYAELLAARRLGRSVVTWRDDTLAVSKAIETGAPPLAARDVFAQADKTRLALVGMSFGGATSAATCRLILACRAAVNMDGQNFDPALFDRPAERPVLLLLSDWTRFPLSPGQSPDPGFSPNDFAYEPWAKAGLDKSIVRIRVEGIRHMGFTDLVSLMSGPKRDDQVGTISAERALAATNDTILAFLDQHLADGDKTAVDRTIAANPELHRHDPKQLRDWAATSASRTPHAP